jgi:hypothetical protein
MGDHRRMMSAAIQRASGIMLRGVKKRAFSWPILNNAWYCRPPDRVVVGGSFFAADSRRLLLPTKVTLANMALRSVAVAPLCRSPCRSDFLEFSSRNSLRWKYGTQPSPPNTWPRSAWRFHRQGRGPASAQPWAGRFIGRHVPRPPFLPILGRNYLITGVARNDGRDDSTKGRPHASKRP